MTSAVCAIDDCDRLTKARGLCRRHYAAHWRAENPEKTLAQQRRNEANRDIEKRNAAARARYRRDPSTFRARNEAWAAANPDKMREYSRRWYEANRDEQLAKHAERYRDDEEFREQAKERARQWLADHPEAKGRSWSVWSATHAEERREYGREWKRANRDRVAEYSERRRSRILGSIVENIDRYTVWVRDRGTCYLCGTRVAYAEMHLDHVIPVARGGDHTYDNVAATHPLCNQRKNAKLLDELRFAIPAGVIR